MFKRIRKLFAPPVFEGDEEKTRIANLLNTILLVIFLLLAGFVVYYIILTLGKPELFYPLAETVVGILVLLIPWFLMRRGHVQGASLLFTSLFLVISVYLAFESGGVRGYEYPSLVLVPVVAAQLLGGRAAIAVGGLTMLAGLGLVYVEPTGLLVTVFDPADYSLLDVWVTRSTDFVIVAVLLHLASRSLTSALDKARRSERAHAKASRDLQESQISLVARTHALERRSAYLEASAQVGHAAASILETDQLMRQVVDLIRERFDLYYVGLFLVEGEWAMLRAGTGEAGRVMLARGHRLRVGAGMIGWSIANAQARVALEAGEDAVRLATAELPDTRSEAALPLRSRGRVIGALTVQHVQPGAFDQDTITVLQTMADQVAVAMDNARLFAASQEALQAERRAYGELSREAWAQMARARPWGYRSDQRGVFPSTGDWQPEMAQATQTGQSVQMDGAGAPTLAIPIKVRDHVVGALRFHKHETGETWTTEETALLETLTDRLAEALESARFYQDAQRRAARERLTGEVTARMRETLDVETVLETATDEIYRALGLEKIIVRLATEEADDESAFGDPTITVQRGRTPQEEVV